MKSVIKSPPPALRAKVGNSSGIKEYMEVGLRTAASIENFLGKNGFHLRNLGRVLDFACGCGRTLNFLRHRTGGELVGCDYDPELVSWCQENLTGVSTHLNPALPPTPFPDSSFDLIYAISFFTHIPERSQKLWLREWARIMKPGGVIVVSLHGASLARRNAIRIPSHGFLHQPHPSFKLQVSYQTREQVQREWSSDFEILAFDELGLLYHQDLVMLGVSDGKFRRGEARFPVIPDEVWEHYRLRPDLQAAFGANGLGKENTLWTNLSLNEWSILHGNEEAPALRHLALESLYEIHQT